MRLSSYFRRFCLPVAVFALATCAAGLFLWHTSPEKARQRFLAGRTPQTLTARILRGGLWEPLIVHETQRRPGDLLDNLSQIRDGHLPAGTRFPRISTTSMHYYRSAPRPIPESEIVRTVMEKNRIRVTWRGTGVTVDRVPGEIIRLTLCDMMEETTATADFVEPSGSRGSVTLTTRTYNAPCVSGRRIPTGNGGRK